jgi:hypothetical protein
MRCNRGRTFVFRLTAVSIYQLQSSARAGFIFSYQYLWLVTFIENVPLLGSFSFSLSGHSISYSAIFEGRDCGNNEFTHVLVLCDLDEIYIAFVCSITATL